MARDQASDLMMKFVLNGTPITGDSTTQLISSERSSNPLLRDFKQGSMFEVDRFTFKAGTSDDDDNNGDAAPAPAANGAKGKAPAAKPAKPAKTLSSIATRGGYQSWRAGKAHQYPVDLQPVSFTRSIDSSSTTLIQNCIDCVSYDSATLIKRKAAGGGVAGEVFLRLDFVGVLVIGVDWSNDDQVEETCQFICRSVTINYRPQLPDGSLGAIVSGFWSMVPGEKQVTLG